MSEVTQELLPCPFCGGAARKSLAQPKNGPNIYAIGCSHCIMVTEWVADQAEAITAWNHRTTHTAPMIAAMERADEWLRAISTWLLETDNDMKLPKGVLDTDPLDIADDLTAVIRAAKGEG